MFSILDWKKRMKTRVLAFREKKNQRLILELLQSKT